MSVTQKFLAAMALTLGVASVQADIILSADPGYPAGAAMFTLDPESFGPAQRGITLTRHLRQTFQLDATIDVAQLVTSLAVASGGVGGGLTISFFEVEDVNAGSWAPGAAVHSFTIPTTTTLPVSTAQTGFSFTGADVFTLAQRNTGTQGYGLEISNADDVTNLGNWRHSNDGTNHYLEGIYYSEGGTPPNAARDMGIALVAVPEPSVALLMLGGLGVISLIRRRNR